ncbi:hypothetical protein ACHWQZ_G012435 [Mnemiopsis leidyi]
MEESPNGMVSSQVPVIGWDMNSPQTVTISPRSVVLPRPPGQSSSSPSGVYFIEQWGSNQRNKRRIRRPPKPNLYKRYDFTSALDTPEKSDSDFDDFSDDVLSQIRLTPILNKTNTACSPSGGRREFSPTQPGPSTVPGPSVPQVFKTPTMFKTSSRTNHEQTKVQPRKLTSEFDNAKSPVHCRHAPTNQNVKTSYNVPSINSSCPSKPMTTTTEEDEFISDDDEEIFRQADLIYASQSSQDLKIVNNSIKVQPLNQNKQSTLDRPQTSLRNGCELEDFSKSKVPLPFSSAKIVVNKTCKTKENIDVNNNSSEAGFSNDDFSDDSFDDLEIDEALLERINAQNAKYRGFHGQQLPLGRQSPAIPVKEIQGFVDPATFFQEHVIPGRPVVFKGAAKEFPAFQRWSDEYFLSFNESNNWMVQYELGKKETREGGQEPISFAEYIKRYTDEDLYCVTGLPKFLRSDMPIFRPLNCYFVLSKLMDDLVMWFSSGGTKSVWHYDDYENLNCLIKGKKELILANRSELELGHFLREGSFSKVDVDSVDLDSYPGFSEITFYNATIEAGDCVYIPTFWGHVVRSWGRNIAINAWWEIYKTPFECVPSEMTDWGAVSMTTDSDIGKAGEEVMKDTEGARQLSGNFRLILWSSQSMRKEGRISRSDFMAALSDVLDDILDLLEEVYGNARYLSNEEWIKVFQQLDANSDEHLDPQEIDLLSSDETLLFIVKQAGIVRSKDSDKEEL